MTSLTIHPGNIMLASGGDVTYKAIYHDDAGCSCDVTAKVKWSFLVEPGQVTCQWDGSRLFVTKAKDAPSLVTGVVDARYEEKQMQGRTALTVAPEGASAETTVLIYDEHKMIHVIDTRTWTFLGEFDASRVPQDLALYLSNSTPASWVGPRPPTKWVITCYLLNLASLQRSRVDPLK